MAVISIKARDRRYGHISKALNIFLACFHFINSLAMVYGTA
jgi:hypothetical protein